MQPFVHLPLNTKECPKTPLDGRCKHAKYGSMKEQVGGIYMRNDSSDDEREESDFPDGSNGAEVKGDDDHTIGEQKQNVQVIFYKCLVLGMGSKLHKVHYILLQYLPICV